jgi:hypothetical protein
MLPEEPLRYFPSSLSIEKKETGLSHIDISALERIS